MNIRKLLKSKSITRRMGKIIKIYYEFHHDATSFSKNYIESAEKKGDYGYSIMLLVHSLEKGMCMAEPRPFGLTKVKELMGILRTYEDKGTFEYRLGVSVLNSWKRFFEEHAWTKEAVYCEVAEFLGSCDAVDVETGWKTYTFPGDEIDADTFFRVIASRHSVRDFQDKPLDMQDVDFAIRCFLETPTACNRQMCKLIYIVNPEITELLNKTLIGIPGFNKKTVQFFVVTYDLAAFAYSGERQQGLFNSGLCTMNFVNGLHARGIGSCCLQWSNKNSEDQLVRNALGLKESERIGIVVGAGYYLDNSVIPCSVRRKKEDVFRII